MADTAKQIAVVTPAGDVREISSADAADAAEQGFELATPEQVRGARLQSKFDESSALSKAATVGGATVAGALRGVTAGFSDPIITHGAELIGGASAANAARSTLNELREMAPTASTIGEAAGVIGGMALGSGEAGLGAKALTGASRLGRGVESVASRVVGRGIAGRMVAGGLGAAVEGSIYGAGQAASEAALGNEDLTGEKLVAGMTHGAVIGGGIGAALGGLGGALERVRAPRLAAEVTEAAPKGSLRERFGRWASEQADANTIKTVGATQGEVQKALKYGDPSRYAKQIRDVVEADTQRPFAMATKEQIHDSAERTLQAVEKAKGEMLEKLELTGAKPSVSSIADRFQSEIVTSSISHLAEDGTPVFLAGHEEALGPALKFMKQLEASAEGGASFKKLYEERKALDKLTKFNAGPTAPQQATLGKLRDIIEEEFYKSADAAAAGEGAVFSQNWQAAKELQQSMIFAKQTTERGIAADLKNNSIGLRGGIGVAAALMTGHPVGAAVGALGSKIMKEYGDQIAASAYAKVAALAGVQSTVSRVDNQIAEGVSKLLSGAVPKNVVQKVPQLALATPSPVRSAATYMATAKTHREAYEKSAAEVRAAAANPGALAEQVAQSMLHFSGYAPKTAAAAATTAVRGATFLASKLPPSRVDTNSLTPQFEKPDKMASDVEIAKWMKQRDAVNDPVSVLNDVKTGRVSREQIEALKAVYPQIYAQMCEQVQRALIDAKRPLSYEERVRIGVLLDMPTDKTLQPDFINRMQASFGQPSAATAAPPKQGPSRPIDIASTLSTTTQEVAAK